MSDQSEELKQTPVLNKDQILAQINGEEYIEPVLEAEETTSASTATEVQGTAPATPVYIDGYDPESPTEVQLEAMKAGWNPEGVEGKRSLTADEFLDRKPIFDRLHAAEKKSKDVEAALNHLMEMQEAQIKKAREDAVADIKRQMKEAVSIGDEAAAEALSDQLVQMNTQPVERPAQSTVDPTFASFVERNPWYDPQSDQYDLVKVEYAESLKDKAEAAIAAGRPLDKVYKDIENAVNTKFNQSQRPSQKVVPNAQVRAKPHGKVKLTDLNLGPEEIRQARTLMRISNMTEEQYVEQYNKAFG